MWIYLIISYAITNIVSWLKNIYKYKIIVSKIKINVPQNLNFMISQLFKFKVRCDSFCGTNEVNNKRTIGILNHSFKENDKFKRKIPQTICMASSRNKSNYDRSQ